MAILDQAANMASLPLDYSRKRKSRSRRDETKNVAETLAKWKEYNQKLLGKPVSSGTSDKLCESRIDGARTAFHEAGTRLSSVKEEAKGEATGLPGKMDIVEAKEEPRSIDQVILKSGRDYLDKLKLG
ncbi:hypothetical protein RND71_017928 [Anisodus tanguticus]|uniref:Uncharacterized protein n=1 Tax=Anisodus tanguticus TaxID=243964 RepID=A0AAE1S4N9_9SOLA|nr:hypothetical protein RND71_017928 [Anisodus tanguticus]